MEIIYCPPLLVFKRSVTNNLLRVLPLLLVTQTCLSADKLKHQQRREKNATNYYEDSFSHAKNKATKKIGKK